MPPQEAWSDKHTQLLQAARLPLAVMSTSASLPTDALCPCSAPSQRTGTYLSVSELKHPVLTIGVSAAAGDDGRRDHRGGCGKKESQEDAVAALFGLSQQSVIAT